MSSEEDLERHIQKNALAIDELVIRIETLNRQANDLLEELKVSPEQLSAFIEKKDYFTEENWKTIEQQRKALDERLLRELANIRNPAKTKKTLAERHVPAHWLFVR
jgi:hypothetical protein